jgi:hypothetical protein
MIKRLFRPAKINRWDTVEPVLIISKDLSSLYASDDNVAECSWCPPDIASRSGEAGGRQGGLIVA